MYFRCAENVPQTRMGTDADDLDRTFRALADSRRRRVLAHLVDHRELALADLADETAATEAERPLHEVDPEAVATAYFSLYHHHVPELEAAGLVEYSQSRDTVAITDRGERVQSLVCRVTDQRV